MNIESYVNQYQKMSKEELRRNMGLFLPNIAQGLAVLEQNVENFDAMKAFMFICFAACSQDGKLDYSEYELFVSVSGIEASYSDVKAAMEEVKGEELDNLVNSVVDCFGSLPEVKEQFVKFCICFCAANGVIDAREKAFLQKLAD